VVGGGLAGLACAATAARDGRSVILLEKSSRAGGRAATQDDHGFQFNLGPHALYRGGAAARVLADLGIPLTGGVPVGGRRVVRHGRLHRFPAGLSALLRTTALPLRARLAAARFVAGLAQIDPVPLNDVTVGEWLDGNLPNRDAQALLLTLIRLSTYANDPERQSAGAAIAQLQ